MIELDGSNCEGGGQILRSALGLSVLTQKPFRILNIRKNRPKPGLKAQHLACVKACAELSNAYVEGNKIGSETLEFVPRVIKNRQLEINIGTAGSITLLMQSILLPAIFTNCDIKITGGTDVKWSMPIDYFKSIMLPFINKFCKMEILCEKRGYYPVGGGIISLSTKAKYKRVDFDSFNKFHQYIFGNPVIDLSKNGKLMSIKGISSASKDLQERNVVERQAQSAELSLSRVCPINVDKEYVNTSSPGAGIMLYATYKVIGDKEEDYYRVGVDVLGDIKTKAEENGRVASEKMLDYINSSIVVDECLQDNIIPFLGLFGGIIKTGKITRHTKSNIEVCKSFLDVEYEIKNQSDANFISVLSSKRP